MGLNKEKIYYGVFEYEGKEYPFVLENQILTIPKIPFRYSKNFAAAEQIDIIQGVTNSNRDIVFLDCEVLVNSNEADADNAYNAFRVVKEVQHLLRKRKCQCRSKEGNKRRWPIMLYPISMEKRIVFMRC